jgi:hypothetical protein
MVTALLVLAAEAAEPSKTAFYICGALLAGWAVVLAAIGLSRAEFPTSDAAERGVIGLSLVLVAATIATAVITA